MWKIFGLYMSKRIHVLEEGKVPDRSDKEWKKGREISKVTGKACKRLREEFEVGGIVAQKGLWHIAKERILEHGGALPKEEGDIMREYGAMNEERFLSGWLRNVGGGIAMSGEKGCKEVRKEEDGASRKGGGN